MAASRTAIAPAVTRTMKQANIAADDGIILTFLNAAILPLWEVGQICHARAMGLQQLLRRLVVVCWDDASYDKCRHEQLQNCVRDEHLLDRALLAQGAGNFTSVETGYHDRGVRHKLYLRICWRRVELVSHALGLGIATTLADADVLFLSDPAKVYKRRYGEDDMQVTAWTDFRGSFNRSCVQSTCRGNTYNGGIYHARPTQRTREMFERLVRGMVSSDGRDTMRKFEQVVFSDAIRTLRATFVNPAYIQGDSRSVMHYCRRSGLRRCTVCDKVAVHVSASGNFLEKRDALERVAKAFAVGCLGMEASKREAVLQCAALHPSPQIVAPLRSRVKASAEIPRIPCIPPGTPLVDRLGSVRCTLARRRRACWRKVYQGGCQMTCGRNCSFPNASTAAADAHAVNTGEQERAAYAARLTRRSSGQGWAT